MCGRGPPRYAAALGVLAGFAAWAAPANVKDSGELRRALSTAGPGTRILLAPGTYEGGIYSTGLRGEDGNPIVIAAAERGDPPVFRGGGQSFHFSDAAHLELQDLVIEGMRANGINIDDGGSFESPAHHVVLRRVAVRDVGGSGNQDGIKLSGVVDFTLEDCTVERWGRGGSAVDMVGCHRGLIEGCVFRDRESEAAANAVQTKGGSRDVTVRRCRFEHAGGRAVNIGGSTGLAYFRPKPEGYEAKDITVEGCTFCGSQAPVAFVGVDGATVRFNTMYRPRAWFLRILQETRGPDFVPSRNGRFADNLIVYRAGEIRAPVNIGPGTAPETFTFARNYWYCADRPDRSRPRLPVEEAGGRGGEDPLLSDPEKGDFTLGKGSPARGTGAGALPAPEKAGG